MILKMINYLKFIENKIIRVLHQNQKKKYPDSRLQMKLEFTKSNYESSNVCKLAGFQEIRFTNGLEDEWVNLINATQEFGNWNIEKLRKEILNDLIENGGILIKNQETFVACASICAREKYKPYALLMYVIVKREFRGLGLGRFVTIQALSTARKNGFPGVVLRTDDYRIPAIKLYSQLGFTFDSESGLYSKTKWAELMKRINGER